MADNKDTKDTPIPANAPRLGDKIKKMFGLVLHHYTEKGEENKAVETIEAHKDGKVVGRYVKHDGKVVEAQANHDAQQSGHHDDIAAHLGQDKEDIQKTAPTEAAHKAAEKADKKDSKKESRPKETHEADKAKPSAGDSKEVKTKAPSTSSSKPDNSMSKMASMESAETQGGPDLSKSYEIKAEPGKLVYTKKTADDKKEKKEEKKPAPAAAGGGSDIPGLPPVKLLYDQVDVKPSKEKEPAKPTPPWKKDWEAKSAADRMKFMSKLAADRERIGKGTTTKGKVDLTTGKKKPLSKSDTVDSLLSATLGHANGPFFSQEAHDSDAKLESILENKLKSHFAGKTLTKSDGPEEEMAKRRLEHSVAKKLRDLGELSLKTTKGGKLGNKPSYNILTAMESNAKTAKNSAHEGFLSAILHLAPATLAGVGNTCVAATEGCRDACLNTAGRGGMFKAGEDINAIQKARIRKTQMLANNPGEFMNQLIGDIEKIKKYAKASGKKPVVRLNGTSDIAWEDLKLPHYGGKNIFEAHPDVQFYDYTKRPDRVLKNKHENYHITFSNSGKNETMSKRLLDAGHNVAVVFGGDSLPKTWNGKPVISGDEHDLRFLDAKGGHVVGLKAKGEAKADKSGFVVWNHEGNTKNIAPKDKSASKRKMVEESVSKDIKKSTVSLLKSLATLSKSGDAVEELSKAVVDLKTGKKINATKKRVEAQGQVPEEGRLQSKKAPKPSNKKGAPKIDRSKMTRDQKIKASLDQQAKAGSPYANKRDDNSAGPANNSPKFPKSSIDKAAHLKRVKDSLPGSDEHYVLARKQNTHPAALHLLAELNSPSSKVVKALLDNPTTGSDTLDYIKSKVGKDWDANVALANHPKASPKLFRTLFEEFVRNGESPRISSGLAHHPSLPDDVAHEMIDITKPDSITHHALITNPSTSKGALAKLHAKNKWHGHMKLLIDNYMRKRGFSQKDIDFVKKSSLLKIIKGMKKSEEGEIEPLEKEVVDLKTGKKINATKKRVNAQAPAPENSIWAKAKAQKAKAAPQPSKPAKSAPAATDRKNMTRDEKIKAALAQQAAAGSPYAEERAGVGASGTKNSAVKPSFSDKAKESSDKSHAARMERIKNSLNRISEKMADIKSFNKKEPSKPLKKEELKKEDRSAAVASSMTNAFGTPPPPPPPPAAENSSTPKAGSLAENISAGFKGMMGKSDCKGLIQSHLKLAKECHEKMEKSSGKEADKWRSLRDHHVTEGEKLIKAQYAKTEPVEDRVRQRKEAKAEEKNKKIIARQIKKDAIEVSKTKTGASPGKGIASESPKKTLREPNKVKAGEQVNPRKD
jgi:hypothetical protein